METWKTIPGYDGWYDVSDHGTVRSWKLRNGGPIRSAVPFILKGAVWSTGYRVVQLSDRRRWGVHQLVALAFLGEPDDRLVRHLNDDPLDNRVENLAYGSPADNAQDALMNGRNANANKTHCPRGHEYSSENTGPMSTRGGRRCLTCHRDREAARQKEMGK